MKLTTQASWAVWPGRTIYGLNHEICIEKDLWTWKQAKKEWQHIKTWVGWAEATKYSLEIQCGLRVPIQQVLQALKEMVFQVKGFQMWSLIKDKKRRYLKKSHRQGVTEFTKGLKRLCDISRTSVPFRRYCKNESIVRDAAVIWTEYLLPFVFLCQQIQPLQCLGQYFDINIYRWKGKKASPQDQSTVTACITKSSVKG